MLRWVGAAYLVWLGIGIVARRCRRGSCSDAVAGADARRSFVQGFLTNALNPKVALFFLAFLPQFIDANAPNKGWAFVALGTVFAFNGTIVNVAFAALVAQMRRTFAGPRSIGRWVSRGVGALFVALGVRLAFFEGHGA